MHTTLLLDARQPSAGLALFAGVNLHSRLSSRELAAASTALLLLLLRCLLALRAPPPPGGKLLVSIPVRACCCSSTCGRCASAVDAAVHEEVSQAAAGHVRRRSARRWMPARCGGTASYSPAAPNWQKLMSAKAPVLTAAEQAFLDGPCETLCAMLDDWDITHRRADMPSAGLGVHQVAGLLRHDHSAPLRRPGIFGVCAFLRADQDRFALARPPPRPSRCRTRWGRRNCCCITVPRSRRITTCRGWHAARKCRASHSPVRAPARMPRPFPTPGVICKGRMAGRASPRHQAQLLEAVHHARAGRHGDRAGVPALSIRTISWANGPISGSPAP